MRTAVICLGALVLLAFAASTAEAQIHSEFRFIERKVNLRAPLSTSRINARDELTTLRVDTDQRFMSRRINSRNEISGHRADANAPLTTSSVRISPASMRIQRSWARF